MAEAKKAAEEERKAAAREAVSGASPVGDQASAAGPTGEVPQAGVGGFEPLGQVEHAGQVSGQKGRLDDGDDEGHGQQQPGRRPAVHHPPRGQQ